MDKGTCSDPEGCDSPAFAKALCKSHYNKRRAAALKQQQCKNEGCENPQGPTGGYCSACYNRWLAYGDPNAGPPRRKRRTESPRTGKRSAYHVNHARVRKERGPAWKHKCEHCAGRAQTWAMKHESSGDSPDDYMPLCWPCHAKYDNFAARFPDNRGTRRSPETRRLLSERAQQREARKREARELATEGRLF
jgi:hypothetical protein